MRTEVHSKDLAADVTQKILKVFGEDSLATLARETQWLQRERKFTPTNWVAAIMQTLSGGRVHWLADIWRSIQVMSKQTVNYKPFHKQMCRPGFAEFFRRLLERSLHQFTLPVLRANAGNLKHFRDIIAHDGSSFAVKAALQNAWPGRFTTISPAAVELHVTMSLLEDNAFSVVLSADSESERAHQPTPEQVKDCLLLGDRGYQDKTFFANVQAAGGFFIVRGTKSIRPKIVAAYDARGRKLKVNLVGKNLQWDVLPKATVDLDIAWDLDNGQSYHGRIVAFHSVNKRNKSEFVYLQTNLARVEFPANTVSDLYRLRWQVELFFKECKSHANLHAFDTQKEEIAEGLIWASLVCAVLKRGLTHMAEAIAELPLSTARAAASARHFIDPLMHALGLSEQALRIVVASALDFLCAHARRAHPKRDKKSGRLKTGLVHRARTQENLGHQKAYA
jgi:Transposase DDE domain